MSEQKIDLMPVVSAETLTSRDHLLKELEWAYQRFSVFLDEQYADGGDGYGSAYEELKSYLSEDLTGAVTDENLFAFLVGGYPREWEDFVQLTDDLYGEELL